MTKGKRPLAADAADDDRQTAHTLLFAAAEKATRVPSAGATALVEDEGLGDQLILLLLTLNSSSRQGIRSKTRATGRNAANAPVGCAVVQLTGKRNLVLVPRDLPQYLRGIWCTGSACDYLVYARGRPARQLIAEIQQVLASPSTQRV